MQNCRSEDLQFYKFEDLKIKGKLNSQVIKHNSPAMPESW